MLSKKLLEELKMIVKEDYGIEFTEQETNQIANNLVSYFDLLNKINFRKNDETVSPL
jgi:hypothetical protein